MSAADWLADVFGPDPSAAPPTRAADEAPDGAVVVPNTPAETAPSPDEAAPDVNAGAKKTAIVLGVALVAALTVIVAALAAFGNSPPSPPAHQALPAPAPAPAAPAEGTAAPAGQDQAIPFTASADCPAGSTSAQALTDTGTDSAWVCVRGGVDGQVLHVDLGKTYVLTAASVTPGWVAKTPGGKDEWLQHRVVTRLQYVFNDADRTIVIQDTANTHGPVMLPLNKILASRVTVVVLQTSRPPADPLPTADPATTAAAGGFLDSVLGSDGAPLPPDATQTSDPEPSADQGSDPTDATFAMTALKFFGHQPN